MNVTFPRGAAHDSRYGAGFNRLQLMVDTILPRLEGEGPDARR